MTATQLFQIATEKNCTINLEYENMIGVRFNGKHVWHWFKVDKNDESVWFDHSYSQNTGSTKKGVMHMVSVQSSLGFYAS